MPTRRAAPRCAAFGTGSFGGILSSDELVRALGRFPLPVLAVFGIGITHEQVSELLAAMPVPPGESGLGSTSPGRNSDSSCDA